MKTKDAISRRCSCRAFNPYQISNRELDIVLQGGNAAPIGMGKFDSLHLTVIQNQELLRKIDTEGASLMGKLDLHPLYGAPTLILVSGVADTPYIRDISMCNAACVIQNMMITAADIGLASCFIMGVIGGIRDNKEFCDEMKVPAGFLPCAAVALGYPSKEPEPKELVADKIPLEYVK